jgi:NADP-dependent 3-hydroxy acid dehydrogenase YdfG
MQALSARYRAAFVTGASAGLGRAFAEMLLAEGVEVWGTARSPERLRELERHPRFHPVILELADASAATAAYAEAEDGAGGLDLLINNAGYGLFGAFAEEPFGSWEQQLDVMLIRPGRHR